MMHKALRSIEALSFFKVIHQISRSHGTKNSRFQPNWVRLLGRLQRSNPSDFPCYIGNITTIPYIMKWQRSWRFNSKPDSLTVYFNHVILPICLAIEYVNVPNNGSIWHLDLSNYFKEHIFTRLHLYKCYDEITIKVWKTFLSDFNALFKPKTITLLPTGGVTHL